VLADGSVVREASVSNQSREAAVQRAAVVLSGGYDHETSRRALEDFWDEAFEEGRLAALDEFQDRFCVCMK
jgi:hypothetical protein